MVIRMYTELWGVYGNDIHDSVCRAVHVVHTVVEAGGRVSFRIVSGCPRVIVDIHRLSTAPPAMKNMLRIWNHTWTVKRKSSLSISSSGMTSEHPSSKEKNVAIIQLARVQSEEQTRLLPRTTTTTTTTLPTLLSYETIHSVTKDDHDHDQDRMVGARRLKKNHEKGSTMTHDHHDRTCNTLEYSHLVFYQKSSVRMCLYVCLSVISFGLLPIVTTWWPQIFTYLCRRRCARAQDADVALVTDICDGHMEEVKVYSHQSTQEENEYDNEEADEHEKTAMPSIERLPILPFSAHYLWFEFKKQRYYYDVGRLHPEKHTLYPDSASCMVRFQRMAAILDTVRTTYVVKWSRCSLVVLSFSCFLYNIQKTREGKARLYSCDNIG
jgi:hypothetical protein